MQTSTTEESTLSSRDAADPDCDISTEHGAARPARNARPSSGCAAESTCAGGLHTAVSVILGRRQPRAAGAARGRAQRAQGGPRPDDGAARTLPEPSSAPAAQQAVAAQQARHQDGRLALPCRLSRWVPLRLLLHVMRRVAASSCAAAANICELAGCTTALLVATGYDARSERGHDLPELCVDQDALHRAREAPRVQLRTICSFGCARDAATAPAGEARR